MLTEDVGLAGYESLQVDEQSAIHENDRAGDISGKIGGEKYDATGDVPGFPQPPQWDPFFHVAPLGRIREVLPVDVGGDRSGHH